ncbi:hypothetical protein WJX75_009421 [Coccomyxa subellipsoidea]|uniref:Uncharacterized protein n=1 Tax=Coccomyxa subellipsoidea TaxID=248742 RepID=A0ABR2YZ55_9CHLO
MIRVTVENRPHNALFQLNPPERADRVIKTVATRLHVADGALSAGDQLFEGEDTVLAGDYIFSPPYASGVGGQAVIFGGDPVDDEIEAVPFDQFDFGADVPILRLPSYMLKWARVQSGSDFIQPSDATHRSHSVLHEVFQFLANRKWSASVSSLIGQDDALFWVLRKLAPLHGSSRDDKTSSSHGPAGLDITYADPAIVLGEEKATNIELETAVNQIITKWAAIPHYEKIPFVVCFAIANDRIQAFTLSNPQKVKEREVNFDLTVEADQVRCVKAILNVARLCKYVGQHGLLKPPRLAFNVKHNDVRRIYKVYKQISEEGASTLLDFYKETRLIRFLEKGTLEEKYDGAGRIAFSLSPVGWERRPRTTAEVKVAAKCFLIALEGCHALGWALNDLIWPNVVTSQGMCSPGSRAWQAHQHLLLQQPEAAAELECEVVAKREAAGGGGLRFLAGLAQNAHQVVSERSWSCCGNERMPLLLGRGVDDHFL